MFFHGVDQIMCTAWYESGMREGPGHICVWYFSFFLSAEYLVYPTIFWRCSDQREELCTLVYRESTDTLVHIPEKWNRSLDHMCPAYLSADDSKLARLEECIELGYWQKIENSNVGMLECWSVGRRKHIDHEITRERVPINTIECRWVGEYGDMFL